LIAVFVIAAAAVRAWLRHRLLSSRPSVVSDATAIAAVIEGGGRTLDAQGDTNATWKFQVATTLTVGCQGAAAPQSISLAGGAPAKNVFW
jgi:hypothetical protein